MLGQAELSDQISQISLKPDVFTSCSRVPESVCVLHANRQGVCVLHQPSLLASINA